MSVAAGIEKVLAVMVAGAGVALPSLWNPDFTTPVIGVGMATAIGAGLGTFAAIAYDERTLPRGRLIMLAPATVILASNVVGVVPRALGWEWSSDGVEGGLAGLAAVVLYYLLPPAMARAGELVRSFTWSDVVPFLKHRSKSHPPGGGDPPGNPPPEDPPK